ncbi:guanylate kinase [Xiamenia xianingshaonis]|uniref:Guanylate kinase n=1 Tax=Xiamenia xianingshaonis TaxID=2682776 RepID=A0A9E6MSG5_9ACTN|nr:guanylate kinase [Xiamenia xianingshaonis]NGM16711.1 guanylate kinase [Eggerthellaceae bacterium zg-893]NHM13715.1 guanylate kinase [Xiamenia xianingshaonis]QTU85084.1 guanylate kinase [Xiamenia xianingshaonis]
MRRGHLFVVSGPSGAGKGTLIGKLMYSVPDAWLSVSCTTRQPRDCEIPDVSYHFVTNEAFDATAAQDGFLEWARYSDHAYGTPRAEVEEKLSEGKQVVLEIDVQGARQVKEKRPDAHLVFIEPPSLEELRRRLEARGTEDEETIDKRMAAAVMEMAAKDEYEKIVMNDDVDEALATLVAYVNEQADK